MASPPPRRRTAPARFAISDDEALLRKMVRRFSQGERRQVARQSSRAMHGKVAAGRVEAISFNDEAKQIEICAKIVDDAEWAKVEAEVYTGFSQGGGYVRRWTDESDPDVTRYTANPTEISLVDIPCLPAATFSMIKVDGAVETINFASQVEQVWMTGDGETFKKKADALAHASAAPMLGLVARMENGLAKREKFAPLKKALGAPVFDAGAAIAALRLCSLCCNRKSQKANRTKIRSPR